MPSRFGIMPRYGTNADVKWFEASPCYIYHVVNAWEDGDEIIMDACRVADPAPRSTRGEGDLARMKAFLRLEATLWRWRFNLATGAAKEEQLDDAMTEWPSINRGLSARKSRYTYNPLVPPSEGLVKYHTQTGRSNRHLFSPGRPPITPP